MLLNTYRAKDPLTGKETDKVCLIDERFLERGGAKYPTHDVAAQLAWDCHFWLGKDSSQDEIGVAAYKTVELDDLLDDGVFVCAVFWGAEWVELTTTRRR